MVASLAAAAGPDAGALATADQVGLVDDDGQCVVLVAAGIVAPEPAPTVTASVDAVAFYRQFKAVEKLDADLAAARRRVRTDPAVTAAATRIRKGA
jgi:pyridoxal biosynthesis lyase PdxS